MKNTIRNLKAAKKESEGLYCKKQSYVGCNNGGEQSN